MRAALILAGLLLVVPVVQAQTPSPSVQLGFADVPEGTQVAGDRPFVFDVTVECTFPTADPTWRYRAHVALEGSPDIVVNVPAQRDFPAGLCMQMGSHTERFKGNITFLDDGRNVTQLGLRVFVEPDNAMLQGWPPEVAHDFAWPRADASQGVQAKPQVVDAPPQEETTPGPAIALVLAALVALARRQR